MAAIGAKNPIFCPVKSEPDNAMPIYDDEKKVKVGAMVSANATVNNTTAELYADDRLQEQVAEISSATIAMETDDLLPSVASIIYGAEVEGKKVTYNVNNTPPKGGLSYYRSLLRDNIPVWEGTFFPTAKAAVGNKNAQTKGSSITFQTTTTTFTAAPPKNGDIMITEEFDTEEEVMAWQNSLYTDSVQPVG